MRVSIDISMYPLEEEYREPILTFIGRLQQNPRLSVKSNTMSTQVFGSYDAVMSEMTDEIRTVLEANPQTVFVLKLIGVDRSGTAIDG